jgi:hypothetical protein
MGPASAAGLTRGISASLMNSKQLKAYGTAEMPLSLTSDVTSVVLQVPDEKQAKSGDNP